MAKPAQNPQRGIVETIVGRTKWAIFIAFVAAFAVDAFLSWANATYYVESWRMAAGQTFIDAIRKIEGFQ